MQYRSAYNFGVKGVARQNFGTWRVCRWEC